MSAPELSNWENIPLEVNANGGDKRWVTGEQVMMAQIHSTAGSIAAAHKHDSEQITWVISGRLRCIVGEPGAEQTFEMGPGDVLMVPGFVPHATETIEDTYQVDVWSPPRTAWAELRRAQEGAGR